MNTRFFIGRRSMTGLPTARNLLSRRDWVELHAVANLRMEMRQDYAFFRSAFRPLDKPVRKAGMRIALLSFVLDSIFGVKRYNDAVELSKVMLESKESWALAVLCPDNTMQYHKISLHKVDGVNLMEGAKLVDVQRTYVEGQAQGCVTVYNPRRRLPGSQVRALR